MLWRSSNRILCAAAVVAVSAALAGCAEPPRPRKAVPSYDPYTSVLLQLSADQNGDGRLDQWTYLDGTRPLRGEADTDHDGRIDRWEYFDAKSLLVTVGTSSRNDGVEDTWTWATLINGEGRVDISHKRDRQVDRREFYKGKELVRDEVDTNADGKADRWDRYENGVLREAQFDTSLSGARANWRILYDAQAHFVATEADLDRDGRFVPAQPGAGVLPSGGKKE